MSHKKDDSLASTLHTAQCRTLVQFLSGSEGTQLRMHVSVGGSRQELSTAVSIAPAPHPLLFGLLFALEYKNFTQFFSDLIILRKRAQ